MAYRGFLENNEIVATEVLRVVFGNELLVLFQQSCNKKKKMVMMMGN